MPCIEIISTIKDIVIAGSALAGAIVAVKGLDTWRKQLKGQSEYELSRRILVSLFKYRDAINGVRHPAMWAYEMPRPSEEDAKGMSLEQIKFYGTSKAYQARWDKVQEQRTTLYTDLLEAEAIWGSVLNELFKVVFKLENELFVCIENYLELMSPDTSEPTKKALREIYKEKRNIIYDNLSDEPDEYKRNLLNAIAKIETYLKPKLSHEK